VAEVARLRLANQEVARVGPTTPEQLRRQLRVAEENRYPSLLYASILAFNTAGLEAAFGQLP
jgi:hypothetical protein